MTSSVRFLGRGKTGIFLLLFWSSTFQLHAQQADTTPAYRDTTQTVDAPREFRVKPLIVPTGLALSGLLVQGKISRQLEQRVESRYPGYRTHADDYLLFAPVALSLSLGAAGVKGKHPFGEQVILAVVSGLAQGAVSLAIKEISQYPRPDGSSNDAFPSGHTSSAFASATLLHKEYGHRSVWYSVGGYGVATSVGALRIINNRHWLADVLFGAGVGIGATEVVYMAYPWVKRKLKKRGGKDERR